MLGYRQEVRWQVCLLTGFDNVLDAVSATLFGRNDRRCREQAPNGHGSARAVSKAAVAVAVCINVAFEGHYDKAAPSIKACRRCYDASTRAMELVRYAQPNAAAFRYKVPRSSKKIVAVEATEVIAVGKDQHQRTLLGVLEGIPKGNCYDLRIEICQQCRCISKKTIPP